MRLAIRICLVAAAVAILPITSRSNEQETKRTKGSSIAFVENIGQWDSRVLYRTEVQGAVIWLTSTGPYFEFLRQLETSASPHAGVLDEFLSRNRSTRQRVEKLIISTAFVGANADPIAVGNDKLEFKSNFFIGNDQTNWRTDVPSYSSVTIRNVYDGIDVTYYGSRDGNFEYDFVVAPGASFENIRMRYGGTESLTVDSGGNLMVATGWHTFHERQPSIFLDINGKREEIDGRFSVTEGTTVQFQLLDSLDPSSTLIIDPKIVFSTYLGGVGYDEGNSVAVDAEGYVYITGNTWSADFPQLNSHHALAGPTDVFVSKLSPSGESLIYSTYIGGQGNGGYSGYESVSGIAVDVNGRAYICGETLSSDFPRVNNFLPLSNPYNGFVARLSPSGNALEFSSYVGGPTGGCAATEITVDDFGCTYLVGVAYGYDFPVVGAFQPLPGGGESLDGFLLKLDPSGMNLIFSTYFGGNDRDGISGVAVTESGRIAVAGSTNSVDFPLKRPIMTEVDGHYGEDGFVAMFSADGDSLIYSTILGGSNLDAVYQVDVDNEGCAYVTGRTSSANFPVKREFLTFYDGDNGFLSKISPNGDSLIFSTHLGGSLYDEAFDVVVVGGCAVVTGETKSSNFPLKDAYQSTLRSQDGFLTKYSASGDALEYSTFLGGSGYERIFGMAADADGATYVTGVTTSLNFPLINSYQGATGNFDAFVVKLTDEFLCGEVDASGEISLTDIVFLVSYIFANGPQPNPIVAADIDCSGQVTVSDVVYLITYVFSGGPAPCASCP